MDFFKELEIWYQGIRKHKKEGVFSPHKAITILIALSNIYKCKKLIEYNKDRNKIEEIITEITHKKSNCLYPLIRLVSDNNSYNIWKTEPKVLPLNKSGDLNISDAINLDFKAGFSEEIYNFLSKNPTVLQKLIFDIIDDNFPSTLFDFLIHGLEIDQAPINSINSEIKQVVINKKARDPKFPQKILALYDNRCAFCQLKIFYRSKPISIEAAHIKWNAYGGECHETNGIALCPTHHFTLDKGVWTINHNFEIQLSPNALVDEKTDVQFKQFKGKSVLSNIINKRLKPDEKNIEWHLKNIFDNESK